MNPRARTLHPKALAALAGLALDTLGGADEDNLYAQLKRGARDVVARDPIDAAAVTVLTASWLFFKAERGVNPKVKTFADALVFVTTTLSVGYADIFARTPRGKVIASWLMTAGPSLAARLFDAPKAEAEAAERESLDVQRQIAAKLDAILAALEKKSP